jgi:hypothetical protein
LPNINEVPAPHFEHEHLPEPVPVQRLKPVVLGKHPFDLA